MVREPGEEHGLIHLLHGGHHKLHGFKPGLLVRRHEILELVQRHTSKGVIIIIIIILPLVTRWFVWRCFGLGLGLDWNSGTWYRAWVRVGVSHPKALREVDNKVNEILF